MKVHLPVIVQGKVIQVGKDEALQRQNRAHIPICMDDPVEVPSIPLMSWPACDVMVTVKYC